jgi:hypothetical protein
MSVQEILHVLSDGRRQFFDLDGDHIQKTHNHTFLDLRFGKRMINQPRRFTERSRRAASDVDGQALGPSERGASESNALQ